MCGIAGIYRSDGLQVPADVVDIMTRTLFHRGPDDGGRFADGTVLLGSRRLAIQDIPGGGQPCSDENRRFVLVFNGEIYNFRELRKELQDLGYRFRTRSDTEVLLQSYMVWGANCLDRLTGMFAFAIWDRRDRLLFLARDRMGIKPLYTSLLPDGTFLFASEIKAILSYPGHPRRLYPMALHNLLTYGFNLAPHTFFEGITQVLPGHYLEVSEKGLKRVEYWDIGLDSPLLSGPSDEIALELRERLETAVRWSLISDVPVGTYLSGGIDSTAITGLYANLSKEEVRTLSIAFEGADYEETAFSREAAAHFGIRNIEFQAAFLAEDIPNLIYYLEEPMVTLLNLPLFLLSRKAHAEGLKVVLSGDGADEIFGGYDYFRLQRIMAFLDRQATPCRKGLLKRVFPRIQTPIQGELLYAQCLERGRGRHPASPYRFGGFPAMAEILSDAYKASLPVTGAQEPLFFDLNRCAHRPLLDQALYIETKMRLLNLTLPLSDKMGMAHSVEVRPPFLDHTLVDYVFRIPPSLKMLGLNEKFILKKAMKGRVPATIGRRRKQPLQPPAAPFLERVGGLAAALLSDREVKRRGYFNPRFISTLLRAYGDNDRNRASDILVVVFFVHLWDEIFLHS